MVPGNGLLPTVGRQLLHMGKAKDAGVQSIAMMQARTASEIASPRGIGA
jgi:hypothetical protein